MAIVLDFSTQLLLEFALIMIIAGVSSVLFTKARFPAIIGYLAAGMILGPYGLGSALNFDMNTINALADLGIILMMFTIGLEFNITRLRKIGSFAILAGSIEVLAMIGIGYSLGRFLGLDFIPAVFLGAIMSISSTAVILSVLTEMGKIKEDYVESIIGVLIVEDLAAVVLLTLTSPLLQGTVPGFEGTLNAFALILVFLGFSLILGLAVIPRLVDKIAKGYSSETLLLVALGLAFTMALFANLIKLSVSIGAFTMGVIIGHARSHGQIVVKITPIKEMFLAIFFVSIGMLIQPILVIMNLPLVLLIALVFIVGKWAAVSLGCYVANLPIRVAFLGATSMVAMGEFSFIIAQQGNTAGLLSNAMYASVIGAAMVTMIVLPVSVKRGPGIFDWFVKNTPKPLLNTLKMIEGLRADVRKRLSASAEKRKALNHEFFWIIIDIVIIVVIGAFAGVLGLLAEAIERIFNTGGYLASVFAIVIVTAIVVPVIVSLVSKIRKVIRILASSLVDTASYQNLSQTYVYKFFMKMVQVILVGIFLLALLTAVWTVPPTLRWILLIFALVGVLFGYMLLGYFRRTYKRMQKELSSSFIEDHKEQD
ncbi:MAG TPA: cation:proton antiporter [Methanomassiliicoccales archaeon]|nr:cation:proton antiporter [Methanomassiliicoccales archaeon]